VRSWEPRARALVTHFAVRLLPEPESATAEQAPTGFAPSLKLTVPLGKLPLTVAVKVTVAPAVDGFAELVSVVVVAAGLTTCASGELVEVALLVSPL